MGSRNPDFAALVEVAMTAADNLIQHSDYCEDCAIGLDCFIAKELRKHYASKKSAALKAIRKAGKK